jgi:hypothetical protein
MTPCPHAVAPVVVCYRCLAQMAEPPVLPARRPPAKSHRPRAYVVTVGGQRWTFEGVSRRTAARAVCRLLGRRRLPPGTQWEAAR